jgi:FlaA1/EpsC-like NDP-sugar epimerase
MATQSARLAAGSTPGPVRYRLTLLPRPDLIRVQLTERNYRLVCGGDLLAALLTCGPLLLVDAATHAPLAFAGAASLLPLLWSLLLAARGCYRRDKLAAGTRQCGGIAVSGVALVAAAGALTLLPGMAPLRPELLVAAAGLIASSGVSRRVLRVQLTRQRRLGRGLNRVLVVGYPEPAALVIKALDAAPQCGLAAVGACLPFDQTGRTPAHGLPLVHELGEVLAAVDELAIDAVALCSDLDTSGLAARRLLLALAERGVELLVSPGTRSAAWARPGNQVGILPLLRVPRVPA